MAIGGTGMMRVPLQNGPMMHPVMAGMPPLPGTLGGNQTMTPGGGGTGAPLPGTPAPAPASTPAPAPTNALSPTDALNNFANSAGMQFAEQQMANGVNNLFAAHGAVQSGAAAKELQDRAGQIALQNYFFPYLNYLQGQQGMGVGAGSSIAGVGTSFGNTMAGINGNIANAIGTGATNIGNANANMAAINGLANSNLYNTIGSSVGNVASSFVKPAY